MKPAATATDGHGTRREAGFFLRNFHARLQSWCNRGMGIDLHPAAWLFIADWTIRLVALAWIPVRSAPAAARSWLLLVGFLPLLGLPLYLAFGQPWLSKERRERQANASRVIAERQQPLARLRWVPHDDSIADDIARLVERTGDFMPMTGNAIELEDDYAASLRRQARPPASIARTSTPAARSRGAWARSPRLAPTSSSSRRQCTPRAAAAARASATAWPTASSNIR